MNETTNKTEEQQANTIRADELCALSGLSDRRLREIARKGYYPPPRIGIYQKSETIAGLFKYFRDRDESATATLRKEEEGLARAKRRLAELQLEEKLGVVAPVEVFMFLFSNIWLPFRNRLYRLAMDVSYDCENKSRGQIQARIEDGIDKLIDDHKETFDTEKFHEQLMKEIGVKKPKGDDEQDDTNTETNP